MRTAVRVKQTSTTTGTGNLTMAAAPTGFRNFLTVMSDRNGFTMNDWAPYMAENASGSEWEFGVAQVTNTGSGVLERATAVIFDSSNAGSLVNFTGNTTIRLVAPPDVFNLNRKCSVYLNASATLSGAGATTVTWTTEIEDTDTIWTSGANADKLYIPKWADRVHVTFRGWVGGSTHTLAYPIGIYLNGYYCDCGDNFGTIDNSSAAMYGDSANSDRWYANLQADFVVDRAAVADTDNQAYVQCRFSNPVGSSAGTVYLNDTYVQLRVTG